ncbi:hypothetical protein ACIHCV_42955 [Streptomyces sp. NPDC051956]|uniref:MmyB family transcriptional regulator n=1 Tax=Streptomyces sp. NPDC051956 TaxID=3365677 RepID=UPI0037D64671
MRITPGSASKDGSSAESAATGRELLLRSPDFAGLQERYEVTGRKPAHKSFHHPQA